MHKEVTGLYSLYFEKGNWGYSLPELKLNLGNFKTRNQALRQMLTRMWQCYSGPEDETREPQNEDPDLSCKYTEEVYCRAAGSERGE